MNKIIYIDEKSTDTQAKIEISYTRVKISFPGSTSWKDIKTAAGGKMIECEDGVKRSQTIYDAIKSIHKEVTECIYEMPSNFLIEISGHSLGGGLAQEMAFWLLLEGFSMVKLTLDGSIRIGNKAYALFLEKGCVSIVWNETGNDPVVFIWPWLSRVGKVVPLKPRKFPWLDFDIVNGDHMGYWPVEYKR